MSEAQPRCGRIGSATPPGARHPWVRAGRLHGRGQPREPATFFLSGRWAEGHPQAVAELGAVPFFEIGVHGYRHRRLSGASETAIGAEITDGQQSLMRLGVTPSMLFRPPYGDRPPGLAAAARRAGVLPVLWDGVPGDPVPSQTVAGLERRVLQPTRGGSIIVLHVNGRGVATTAALPGLVTGLRQRGFRFVTVSELLRPCGVLDTPAGQRAGGDGD